MATLFQTIQFLDNSGNPLSNGTLTWYAAGTTMPKTTWKDAAETNPHTAPITLDGTGRPPGGAVFIRGSYDLIVKNSAGVPLQTILSISEYNQYDFTGLTASIADLNSTTTTAVYKTSVYTLQLSDRGKTLLCDATSAAFDINLLPVITASNTYKIIIKKVDKTTNEVSIIPNGSETIDNDIDFTLYDYNDFIELHCDGSNWKIVSAQIRGTVVAKTSSATLVFEDKGKLFNCDASGSNIIMTLPDCTVVGRGFTLSFKKTDSSANSVSLAPVSPQKIDGGSGVSLFGKNDAMTIKTNGADWFVVSSSLLSSSGAVTGDVKASYNNYQPGWLFMNDTTIGDALSGAARANGDTQNLFVLLWERVHNLTYCPMYESTGAVVSAFGASALDDYNAHRRLTLTRVLGRSLISRGQGAGGINNYHLGEFIGDEYRTLNYSNMVDHQHYTFYGAVTPGGHTIYKIGPNGTPHLGIRESNSITGELTYYTSPMINWPGLQNFSITHFVSAVEFYIKL